MRRVIVAALAAFIGMAGTARADDTVTLITGDRVTLTSRSEVIVDGPGLEVRRVRGHVHVIPKDVAPLVGDTLDPALFDVTALAEMGYDDAHSSTLPLIVQGGATRQGRALRSIGATAIELRKGARFRLAGADRVWLDRTLRADALDPYLTQIHAPAAWNAGLDGTGVKVAVLDTGVDEGHPALAGQVDARANFTDAPSAEDGNGHGTHVASLLGGTGAGSGGARQGVATGSDLISGKVLGDSGEGRESWVIAGMEWAAAQGADVVNLSLGGSSGERDDPVIQALEHLTVGGTLFVTAAGNGGGLGPTPYTIDTPGSASSALTVGAVSANDIPAFFSGEGPTTNGHRLKPDVTAPGVGLLGARAGARETDLYRSMSGTSQATPIVAGAAAMLMQEHPDWSAQRVKAQIVTTADPLPQIGAWSQGGGRLDLEQATAQDVTSDQASLSFGMLRHPDESPKTREVTVRNDGDEPVTLTISDAERGQAGQAAPDDAVVAIPSQITVPAGGSATTTVILDPAKIGDGLWEGGVSFGTALRLPLGVYDEPERYDLDIRMIDRDGKPYDPATGAGDPNGDATVPILNADTGQFYRLRPDETGHATARVAPGSYSVFGRIVTGDSFAIAGTPALDVHADTQYVIDARKAKRVRPPAVAGQEIEPRVAIGLTYSRRSQPGSGYTEFGFFDPDARLFITPTGEADVGGFETSLRWRLEPTGRIRPGAPDAYDLLFAQPRFTDPLSPALNRDDVADLARVDTTYRPIGPAGEYVEGLVSATEKTGVGIVTRTAQPVPSTSRMLVTANRNVRWGHCVYPPANGSRQHCGDLVSYGRGERAAVQFGAALHPEIFESNHVFGSLYVRSGLGDGPAASGLDESAFESNHFTLYRDGELVGSGEGFDAYFRVPDDPARFRLEHEWRLNDAFSRSREARTVWTVQSTPEEGDTAPPFLTLDYGAAVDGFGRAAPGRPLRLDLRAGHIPLSTPGSDRIDEMTLRWSADGGVTWTRAPLTRTAPAAFRGAVPAKGLRSGREVSLRVTAVDAEGNEVDQTVMGIAPVR